MSRKHYKNGRYAYAVALAGSSTVSATGLSSTEQFNRVVAVSEPIGRIDVGEEVSKVEQPVKTPTTIATPIQMVEQPSSLTPSGTGAGTPETETPDETPAAPDPTAETKPGNRKKWLLLAAAAVLLFLFLRKK